ncbi:hypothetical protein [Mammaliicoccus vitulinus]|uniref:hypothetical protein n=1 Tax=Mammaliicoccus vitulinus TaxID=71237 RepID=UPI00248CD4AB|nr:hypothetical protein [Mammaliicoccus vitulinus]
MIITKELKKDLANRIAEKIKHEFSIIHFSGNLADTINIYETQEGWAIEIPAEMYDIDLYAKTGRIQYLNNGLSYANDVNTSGGFSQKHKNYINRCINKAIEEWLAINKIIGRVGRNG